MIIPKRRAVGLTATVARTSAGALNYTPVAKVDQSGKNDGRTERKRTLVCLCGYGRRIHVPPEPDRTDRACDRK